MIVAFVIKVNSEVNPVSGRGDLEFPIVIDVLQGRADEHFNDIVIPKLDVGLGVVGRPQIENVIRTAE